MRRSREDLLGRVLWDEFPEAAGSTFDRMYHEALANGRAVTFEEYYPPLETWFEVRAYPSADGLSVYFRDVTERRQADRCQHGEYDEGEYEFDQGDAGLPARGALAHDGSFRGLLQMNAAPGVLR